MWEEEEGGKCGRKLRENDDLGGRTRRRQKDGERLRWRDSDLARHQRGTKQKVEKGEEKKRKERGREERTNVKKETSGGRKKKKRRGKLGREKELPRWDEMGWSRERARKRERELELVGWLVREGRAGRGGTMAAVGGVADDALGM